MQIQCPVIYRVEMLVLEMEENLAFRINKTELNNKENNKVDNKEDLSHQFWPAAQVMLLAHLLKGVPLISGTV